MLEHEFQPVFNKKSKILILGTFPSVKSREEGFYYGHPQNRFWKMVAWLTGNEIPITITEKKAILLNHGIAVWDVIKSCEITGSSDSSIRNVIPADLSVILGQASIEEIYANGGKAFELYQKYSYPIVKRQITKLPSTSPANASFTVERLKGSWGVLRHHLNTPK